MICTISKSVKILKTLHHKGIRALYYRKGKLYYIIGRSGKKRKKRKYFHKLLKNNNSKSMLSPVTDPYYNRKH